MLTRLILDIVIVAALASYCIAAGYCLRPPEVVVKYEKCECEQVKSVRVFPDSVIKRSRHESP